MNRNGVYNAKLFYYVLYSSAGIGCKIAGFLTVFSCMLSVFTLMIITGERWYTITYAIHLNRRLKLGASVNIMAVGWIFSVIMGALPLMGTTGYSRTRYVGIQQWFYHTIFYSHEKWFITSWKIFRFPVYSTFWIHKVCGNCSHCEGYEYLGSMFASGCVYRTVNNEKLVWDGAKSYALVGKSLFRWNTFYLKG